MSLDDSSSSDEEETKEENGPPKQLPPGLIPAPPKKGEESAYENFAWFKGTKEIQAKREPETYLAFYNDARRTVLAGEQVFYCYGKRNNHYLLLNYGFALEDNVHDSFEFFVNIDIKNVKVYLNEFKPDCEGEIKPTLFDG